jgi:hypothetical protein
VKFDSVSERGSLSPFLVRLAPGGAERERERKRERERESKRE